MCFCEIEEYLNCAFPDDRRHNPPVSDTAEKFSHYKRYRHNPQWIKSNPGFVPCEDVYYGRRSAETCQKRQGPPEERRRVPDQDCPLCNRTDQEFETGHVITFVGDQITTISPLEGVEGSPHKYESQYVGKCRECEGLNLKPLCPENLGGNGPLLDALQPKTDATGPPGDKAYEGMGWHKPGV